MSLLAKWKRSLLDNDYNKIVITNDKSLSSKSSEYSTAESSPSSDTFKSPVSSDSDTSKISPQEKWSIFDDENVRLIKTIGDGSCFFHSVLMATDNIYFSSSDEMKKDMAYVYRYYLASLLDKVEDGIKIYNKLSRGQLETISNDVPEVSLTNLKQLLYNISESVGQEIIELVSNDKNIDIYIITTEGKYYFLGDKDIYYKNRPSIVLLYNGWHYDLLVYKVNDKYQRIFKPTDTFITNIKSLASDYFN